MRVWTEKRVCGKDMLGRWVRLGSTDLERVEQQVPSMDPWFAQDE